MKSLALKIDPRVAVQIQVLARDLNLGSQVNAVRMIVDGFLAACGNGCCSSCSTGKPCVVSFWNEKGRIVRCLGMQKLDTGEPGITAGD